MKKTATLLAAFLCPFLLKAQDNPKADSLLNVLSVAKDDSNKVKLLFSIADEFENHDPSRALRYVSQAGELSKRIKYQMGFLRSLRHSAYIYSLVSKYDSALFFNKQIYEMVKRTKDSFNIGVSLYNIGVAYRFMSDLDSAIEYTLLGSKMLEGKGYTNIEATIYDGLAMLYYSLIQYDKAIGHGNKSVELARKLGNPNVLATSLSNLGLIYIEIDSVEKANAVFTEARQLCEANNLKVLLVAVMNNLSGIAIRQREYDLLKVNATKAIALATETGDPATFAMAKLSLAMYHLSQQEYDQANTLAREALDYTIQNNLPEERFASTTILSHVAYAQHDFDKGFELTLQESRYIKEVYTQTMLQKEAAMRVRYETEKKDTQIKLQVAELKQRKIINYLLIGGAAALLIVSLLSYRTYKQKQKLQQQRINELETEKKLAATEAVLKGEEQERTRLAKDLHDGLGGMLSGVKYSLKMMKGNLVMTPDNAQAFERSMDMLDSSIKEIRRVAHNMMPEGLVKFGLDTALRDFCNDIDKSGALKVNYQSLGMENAVIDQTVAITIYRIVQELINNSIKHAAATNAIVQVSKTDGMLSFTVEDDGKGFDTAILNRTEGIGWANIQNRVEFLKGSMDVSSEAGKGTSVHIELNT